MYIKLCGWGYSCEWPTSISQLLQSYIFLLYNPCRTNKTNIRKQLKHVRVTGPAFRARSSHTHFMFSSHAHHEHLDIWLLSRARRNVLQRSSLAGCLVAPEKCGAVKVQVNFNKTIHSHYLARVQFLCKFIDVVLSVANCPVYLSAVLCMTVLCVCVGITQ